MMLVLLIIWLTEKGYYPNPSFLGKPLKTGYFMSYPVTMPIENVMLTSITGV
jgi:hypothetical protein